MSLTKTIIPTSVRVTTASGAKLNADGGERASARTTRRFLVDPVNTDARCFGKRSSSSRTSPLSGRSITHFTKNQSFSTGPEYRLGARVLTREKPENGLSHAV